MSRRQVSYEIRLLGVVVDNWPRYELTCKACGGWEQDDLEQAGLLAMVYCRSCRGWFGRRARLNVAAFNQARAEGAPLDLEQFRIELRQLNALGREG